MEDIGPVPSLPDVLGSLEPDANERKKRIYILLARALAKLHEADVYVHDQGKNILVDEREDGILFYFIDFDTVLPFRRINLRRIARTLNHCIRPLKSMDIFSVDESAEYIKEYLKVRGKPELFDALLPRV